MLDDNFPDENDPAGCSQCGRYECNCDDEEDELEVCPYCQRFVCICESLDGDLDAEDAIADISPEVRRYIDKEINDEEY